MEQTLSLVSWLDIDAPHTYLVRADGEQAYSEQAFWIGMFWVVSRRHSTAGHGDVGPSLAIMAEGPFVKRDWAIRGRK